MAWQNIPNNSYWQFDNNPPDPGYGRVGDGDISRGELSKTYWDAQ